MSHYLLLCLIGFQMISAQITVVDSLTNYPVSYATVSFGNGNGLFADDEGIFIFTKKLYPDIDSLFISALGFKTRALSTNNLPKLIKMQGQVDELKEVVITLKKDRKFKEETLPPYLDDNYYSCWLPTIESEIAVYFPKTTDKDQKLKEIIFPITPESKDWKKRNRKNSEKKPYSTLFKVKFYSEKNGQPGDVLSYETVVFRATEKDGNAYSLNVEAYNIEVPKSGLFVSLQVLGYTDKSGKLLPNKKYKEIKSNSGIVKIPTNFRPLLPFTNKIETKNTFIKRIFINDNTWGKFDLDNGFQSSLLKKGLFNYGIGITYLTFKE